MSDVIVVGGGVIGLLSALRMAQAGLSVEVFEKSDPFTEASWAGLGVLSPSAAAGRPPELVRLMQASLALYAPLAAELKRATRIDIAFEHEGMLYAAMNDAEMAELAASSHTQTEAGVPVRVVSRQEAHGLEPHLAPSVAGAVIYSASGVVDNWRLASALVMAATQAGVHIHPNTPVSSIEIGGGRVSGVQVGGELKRAPLVVLAAGAWCSQLVGAAVPVGPAKGQALLLDCAKIPDFRVTRVLDSHAGYVVPRHGNRVLIGATVEDAGFDKQVSDKAIDELVAGAIGLVPALTDATVIETWAGLRPRSADDQPVLGPVPGYEGLIAAAGHFRNGILLAPVTAECVRDWATGKPVNPDAARFSPARFARAAG
ncbi:MAG: glycine oxidase ThiO [Chloroflexi bacterium]|nr:glycine oxidase ThiO [Chloroflexota bacterium]